MFCANAGQVPAIVTDSTKREMVLTFISFKTPELLTSLDTYFFGIILILMRIVINSICIISWLIYTRNKKAGMINQPGFY